MFCQFVTFWLCEKKTFENFILFQAVSSLVGVSQTSRNTVIRGNVSRIIDSIVFRFSLLPCFKVRFDGFFSQVGCRAVYGKLRRVARVGGGGGEQDADGRQLGRAQACQAPLGRARPAFEDGGLAQATSIWQPAQGSVGDCRRAQMREGPDELKSQIKIIGALYSVKKYIDQTEVKVILHHCATLSLSIQTVYTTGVLRGKE